MMKTGIGFAVALMVLTGGVAEAATVQVRIDGVVNGVMDGSNNGTNSDAATKDAFFGGLVQIGDLRSRLLTSK